MRASRWAGSWVHQIPTGNELAADPTAGAYWTALYLATLALLVLFRIVPPIVQGFWYRLRVAAVTVEGPGVVSLRITGRHLDRLGTRVGPFFLWRFLTWSLPTCYIDDILAHELVHLCEPRHHKRFWSYLERIMPDFATRKEWLAENGGRF